MEYKSTKKTLRLWQIRIAAALFALSAVFFVLARYSVYFYLPIAISALLAVLAVFWYLPAFFKQYTVFVGKNAVVVKRGVLVETSHIMPYKRLVFAGSYVTPLSKLMGLKGIVLRAARANLFVAEIENSAAEQLIYGLCGEK